MMNFIRFSVIASTVMVLSACGGGGSDTNSSSSQVTYSPVGVWRDNSSPGYLVMDEGGNFWAVAQPNDSLIAVYNGNYSSNGNSDFSFSGDIEVYQTGYQPVMAQVNGNGNVSSNLINTRTTFNNQTFSGSFSFDTSLNQTFTIPARTYTMLDGKKITFSTPQNFSIPNVTCTSYGNVTYTTRGFNYFSFKNCASGLTLDGVVIKDAPYFGFIARVSNGALSFNAFQ